jgi:hypothetical protein
VAGKLLQVATETVTSSVSSVTLTGIDSDNVYMLAMNGVDPSGSTDGYLRVTVSGTADTTANYDYAYKGLRADTTFSNLSTTNLTYWNYVANWSTDTVGNAIVYLYNFNNSSEYSFITNESVTTWSIGGLLAPTGGAVHTVAQSCDGIEFSYASATIDGGTFTLFKVL